MLLIVIVIGISWKLNNPFLGYWEAIEIKEDGSEYTWAEAFIFDDSGEFWLHSMVLGEMSGNPVEGSLYQIDKINKELCITTYFGVQEIYKYKFIDKNTFKLDNEFENMVFRRITKDQAEVFMSEEI
jgi:hypothetical protein